MILYLHFPFAGHYSFSNWFGQGKQKQALAEILKQGFNVVGLFHGHYHGSGMYQWEGFDVYNVGSVKHSWLSFAVVRVTDSKMTVVSRNFARGYWWWFHSKPINGADGENVVRNLTREGELPRALIPYPDD